MVLQRLPPWSQHNGVVSIMFVWVVTPKCCLVHSEKDFVVFCRSGRWNQPNPWRLYRLRWCQVDSFLWVSLFALSVFYAFRYTFENFPCFGSVKEVMKKLQEYVDDINTNIEKLATRGPVSKYVLPEENLRGRFGLSSSLSFKNLFQKVSNCCLLQAHVKLWWSISWSCM